MCSLVSISGNNTPVGIKNLESNKDDKRRLQQSDNYIILYYVDEIEYDSNFFTDEYRQLISYVKNGDVIINNPDNKFTVEMNTPLEVHFSRPLTTLKGFFDTDKNENWLFGALMSVDFSHFDTSLVTSMATMFYGCEYLESLDLSNVDTSKVTSMSYMFFSCSALQSLELSNFDTSAVTSMIYMLNYCSSLQYLIISNFDFNNNPNLSDMLGELTNLEYIDISNVKDSGDLLKNAITSAELNNKDNLIVCQNNNIITNTNAKYQCCDITDNTLVCDVQTTIPIIQTTISIVQSTIPQIQTTISITQTTIPIIQTTIPSNHTNIPQILTTIPITQTTIPLNQTTTSQIQTDTSQIQTAIPQIQTATSQTQTTTSQIQTATSQIQTATSQIQTTTPQIQTTAPQIQTTTPQIRTTTPQIQATTPQIQTTTPQIQTTTTQIHTSVPEIKNTKTDIILIGFSSFKIGSTIITFYIHLASITEELISSLIKVVLSILYNKRIRILEEEIECRLKETNNKDITSYLCEAEIDNSNIKQVKINPNFEFVNQNNVTIVGTSPLAKRYMDNLQDIDDKFDNLQNSTIYIRTLNL